MFCHNKLSRTVHRCIPQSLFTLTVDYQGFIITSVGYWNDGDPPTCEWKRNALIKKKKWFKKPFLEGTLHATTLDALIPSEFRANFQSF